TSAPDPPAPKSPDGATRTKPDSPQPKVEPEQSGQQTKRILWIIPNYRSVSANTYLPPQSFKEKFWMATQDSFDYSAFVYVGILSGTAWRESRSPLSARALPAMETTLRTVLPTTPSRITWWKRSFLR